MRRSEVSGLSHENHGAMGKEERRGNEGTMEPFSQSVCPTGCQVRFARIRTAAGGGSRELRHATVSIANG